MVRRTSLQEDSVTTIAIGNLKGGIGATTLAVNLAALLQHAGHDVALVDCGSGAVVRWVQRRNRAGLGTIECKSSSHEGTADEGGSSYTVIDVGAHRKSLLPLLGYVDLWLAPTPPVFPDYAATLNVFDLWRDAREEHGRPGLFAAAITQVGSGERDLEWMARRKLFFARQEMLVLNQSLARHAAWDATYGGHAMHELPSHVAGKAASEFSTLVLQFLAFGLNALTEPGRLPTNHNGRPNAAVPL